MSIIRMGLAWARSPPKCGSGEEDNQFAVVREVHYLHFAIISAAVTVIVNIVVSLLTKPRSKAQVGHEAQIQG